MKRWEMLAAIEAAFRRYWTSDELERDVHGEDIDDLEAKLWSVYYEHEHETRRKSGSQPA